MGFMFRVYDIDIDVHAQNVPELKYEDKCETYSSVSAHPETGWIFQIQGNQNFNRRNTWRIIEK